MLKFLHQCVTEIPPKCNSLQRKQIDAAKERQKKKWISEFVSVKIKNILLRSITASSQPRERVTFFTVTLSCLNNSFKQSTSTPSLEQCQWGLKMSYAKQKYISKIKDRKTEALQWVFKNPSTIFSPSFLGNAFLISRRYRW